MLAALTLMSDRRPAASSAPLAESGDKVTSEDKAKVEHALDALKEALKGSQTGPIKSAAEDLSRVWNEVSTRLYQQAAEQPGGPAGPAGPGGESPSDGPKKKDGGDGPVEADYEVVK